MSSGWLSLFAVLLVCAATAPAQTNDPTPRLLALQDALDHVDAKLTRQMNELLWFQRLADIASVDTARFTGPPPRGTNGPALPPGTNEVIVSALTFLPREPVHARKLPLIIFVHGDIHGNMATEEDLHVVRELVQQGYAVIAPDYRGSSGYGPEFWRLIDYGGLEIEDVNAARQLMLDSHPEIDPHRVGIIGWSHGGFIALMTVFAHPEAYQACYACAPVSDLEERIRIRGESYEAIFSAPYHLGKTFAEAPDEYHRRSPSRNAEKLRVPLLLHANTADEDVNILEVEKLIQALQAAEKQFACHIYTNAPGGHRFNRLDTPAARESRVEAWRFLDRYLHPPRPAR